MIGEKIENSYNIGNRCLRKTKILYIIVYFHEGSTAKELYAEPSLLSDKNCHFYIDNTGIFMANNPNIWITKHLLKPLGVLNNENSIGVAVCNSYDTMSEQTNNHLISTLSDLCVSLGISPDHIVMDPESLSDFSDYKKMQDIFDIIRKNVKKISKTNSSGCWDVDTTLKLQKVFDLPQTGVIQHQDPYYSYDKAFTSGWLYDHSGYGDPLICAMQIEMQIEPTGVVNVFDNENDFLLKLMQRYDTLTAKNAIESMQNKLSEGRF